MGGKRTWIYLFLACYGILAADTFRHLTQPNILYHGYVIAADESGTAEIHTLETGLTKINLADFELQINPEGRNRLVPVLSISDEIAYEIETSAFEEALRKEARRGPLFILIEIDTPGGRVDLTQRLCAAVSGLRFCPTVAFIKGEKNLGAYSAGTAVALACDKIYMAPNTAMGAVTAVVETDKGLKTEKEVYGEAIGEKFGSAWRGYLAALAEKNKRPGILAKAMENMDIEVLEIRRGNQTLFIEAKNKQPGDQVVEVFCKKGELLTLTPERAVRCGMADGIAESRSRLLALLNASDAQIQVNQDILKAREELELVIKRFNKLMETLDLRFKELTAKQNPNRSEVLKALQDILRQTESLIRLKQKYPDVPVSEEKVIRFRNTVKAEYENFRTMR
ncbi:MAG: hypothetical protein WHS88_01090 [Anaerohalosphaeraceae bacterium]